MGRRTGAVRERHVARRRAPFITTMPARWLVPRCEHAPVAVPVPRPGRPAPHRRRDLDRAPGRQPVGDGDSPGGSPLQDLRVLVVDDHELLAQSLMHILQSEGMAASIVTGPNLDGIVASAAQIRPDVVLLDENLGRMGAGSTIIGRLTDLGCRVVMITAITDRATLAECIEAGAVGIIEKAASVETLLEALVRTAATGSAMSEFDRQEWLAELRSARADRQRLLAPFVQLTPRECDVLRAMADGLTAAEIVDELYVSLWTVRGHIKSILAKLGVTSQLTAVARARQAGWL